MNNPNASSTFRSELQSIVNDRSTSFMNVEKYLNRLDPNTLSSLEADARRIAELSGGVSDTESKALSFISLAVSTATSPVTSESAERASAR